MLSLVIEKMASIQHKAFSVLEFSKTSSVIMVQRAFRRHYGIDPQLAKNIRRWYKQFQETGEESRATTHFRGKCAPNSRGLSAKPVQVHSSC